jgi:hypothetical protein
MTINKASRLMGIGLVIVALLVPGAAVAKEGDVIKTGSCTGASTWKLKLSDEDLGKEVKIEVDQNVVGDQWKVRFVLNGDIVFDGKRVTKAPSGSFKVRRVLDDSAGTDALKVRARNRTTGEVCQARARF